MRLLVFTESLDISSGWGAYSSNLLSCLEKNGVQIDVLTTETADFLPSIHAPLKIWIRVMARLNFARGHFSAHDLLHVHVEPYARLAPFTTLPFVITAHGTYAQPLTHGSWLATRSFSSALRQCVGIAAVSAFTRSRLPVDVQEKSIVIHNGVDLHLPELDFCLPRVEAHPIVLSVGAMKPRKGLDCLILGFADFKKRHPSAALIMAGDNTHTLTRDALFRLVDHLGLRGSVLFLGKVTPEVLRGWYRTCDIFALTPVDDHGSFEGFGLVYLEANVFGKPCVGSRNSGAGEAIKDGVTGILVDPFRTQDVARGLEQALFLDKSQIILHTQKRGWERTALAYRDWYISILRQRSISV